MKKQKKFIILVFIIVIIYLIILYVPKNYETDYIINKVKVNEIYNKRNKQYKFTLTYENIEYPIIINTKYHKQRKLIKDIKIISDENDTCLNLTILEQTQNLCSDKKGLKDYRLINEKLYSENYEKVIKPIKETEYENFTIYNNDMTYLIWNYNGYVKLSDNNEIIKILSNEKYNNIETYQNNTYLVIPDYDSSYYFKKIYIYDTNKNDISIVDFNYEISYNILYLGTYKNKLYFLDLKNKNEFELNLKKKKIKMLNEKDNYGLFLNNNKLEKEKVDNLVKNQKVFNNEINNNYVVEDNYLYKVLNNYKIKVSNQQITSIIRIIDNDVYYLVGDTLYRYTNNNGEEKLLKHKEWKYNYKNQIFIFNK